MEWVILFAFVVLALCLCCELDEQEEETVQVPFVIFW